ncbi:DUF2339 domain-containing protein [Oryzicola mucosus]|uniref:DUF2339 domain-containing protein n=1 Tax=Oryzicola mucosus TaxID=2767425 RepID=A0A8J6PJ17_9HYPH|nr:DUF2339 domain-containing protein [Oryzicola mucosus]MBD0415834.1 DUF2339 domain-containing protein [Oryzicola mucosus]
MFEGLIGFILVLVPLVLVLRLRNRVGLLERELGALRSLVLSGAVAAKPAVEEAKAVETQRPESTDMQEPSLLEAETPVAVEAPEAVSSDPQPVADSPWEQAAAASVPAETVAAKPDIETALGTRWAVWVGGVALALGGVFLVRYSIEAGYFGPAARLTLAALFGLVLIGGGEFIRRTGFKVPVQGAAAAYIPAILTAAGAFTLFGVVYAAYGVYGFLGPVPAFLLMGLIGVATIAASLVHGRALAGVGLLGSFVTPMLVDSQAPNVWALFGYLAIVLAATAVIARMRSWSFLMAAAFVGTGLWTLLYIGNAAALSVPAVLFMTLVSLALLLGVWLTRRAPFAVPGKPDAPSIAVAFLLALAAISLFIDSRAVSLLSPLGAAVLILAMVGGALYRGRALPLLHGAGAAVVLIYLRYVLGGVSPAVDTLVGGPAYLAMGDSLRWLGLLFGAVFPAAGFWSARRMVAEQPLLAANWSAWAVIAPFAVATCLWLGFGNIDRDLFYAAVMLVLALAFAAGGEWVARAEHPPLSGGVAVSIALGGAAVAAVVMLHMAFGSGLTTVFCGVLAAVPALATRQRAYPVLGWLSAALAVVVIGRIALDPTIVGADRLSTTPVFNWLLLGYGVPALAFLAAAWQLRRTADGRPRLIMEAATALLSLLTVAMLVRHAMNGGVITSSAPTLAEQAIYTLLALGSGGIMVSLDMRSPSSVLRYGSLGMGVVSAAFIAIQHFGLLNPLFTGESTGRIPVFNLLFLGYLLPAVAAAGLAWYARDKRPKWYSAMLAAMASLLVFAYATLSVRRLFKGEYIGSWAGLEPWETYSYSALWLIMGVGLLVAGVQMKSQVLRIASAALIVVSVAKVFLFDMSELEGVLRALSFIGLGAVLIGIGLFYQKLLTRAAR